MKQFTLPLLFNMQRPTVLIKDFHYIRAMIDTSALFPVWVREEQDLQSMGGVLIAKNQPFGGFGGITTGNLYRLPYFKCGDLIFPDFPILARKHNLPCQMLLSSTMFSGLVYEIDDCNHRFNISVPDNNTISR